MKFISKYSCGTEITPLQYIVEIICENKAKKDKTSLPEKFWQIPKWANFYKSQLRKCSQLCNKHGHLKVLDFVKNKFIYSLHNKWIDDAISDYNYVDKHKVIEEETEYNRDNKFETGVNKKQSNSIFDKLNEL